MSHFVSRLMAPMSKAKSALDVNGDGHLNHLDITYLYDRNKDGSVTMDDVRELYPEMFYASVKKASNILPYIARQPMGWLAFAISLGSIYASWHFYGELYESGGPALGIVMSLISAMVLFAMAYYTGLKWNVQEAGAKIIALGVVITIALADIVAFMGWVSHSRDIDSTSRALQAQNVKDLMDTNKQLAKIRAEGMPRSSADISRDLYIEGKKLVKVGRKRKTARYICPKQPKAKGCRKWADLRTQLTRAETYERLDTLRKSLCAKGYCDGTKKTGVKEDVLVDNVAGLTGLDRKYVNHNVDRWMAIILELLMMAVMYNVTLRANKMRDEEVSKRLALIRANNGIEVDPREHVAQLRAAAQQMRAKAEPSPQPAATPSAKPAVPATPSQPVVRDLSVPAPKGPVTNGTQSLIEQWRMEELTEANGFWMSEDEAYEAFKSWAVAKGISVPPADGPVGFHASVRALGQMKLQARNGVAGYVGYARRSIPVAA